MESVELKVAIRTNREAAARIKQVITSARLLSNGCEITIDGKTPAEVAAKARETLDAVRKVITPPERI